MDSRIREIEQWVAEAREGLCEGGRDAYLRKLYLLEAEIRAVIKENGVLPEGLSPALREERVRRFHPSALGFSAAAGVLVLAAASFYFSGAAGLLRGPLDSYLTAQPLLASSRGTVEPVSDPPTRMTLGEFLASQGEELVLDESGASATEPRLHEAATAPPSPAVEPRRPGLILASTKAAQYGVMQRIPSSRQQGGGGNEATDVVMSVFPAGQPETASSGQPLAGGGGRGPSSGFNEGGFLARALTFPEGSAPALDKGKLQSSLKQQFEEICKLDLPAIRPEIQVDGEADKKSAEDADSGHESSAY